MTGVVGSLAPRLEARVVESTKFAQACSDILAHHITVARKVGINTASLKLSYELAFLRVVLSWEQFLEQCAIEFLMGKSTQSGYAEPLAQAVSRSRGDANTTLLAGASFVTWANPHKACGALDRVLGSNHAVSRMSALLRANVSLLEDIAAIRNRIAHASDASDQAFKAAVIRLSSSPALATSPGHFLRGMDGSSNPPRRYIESLASALISLSRAMTH